MVTTTRKKSEYEKSKDDDLVITPGGPRPKSSVRNVGPDEVVNRGDDGTYSVSRRQLSKSTTESEQQEKTG
jgi:hypothetical protein